jgi:hypothetical protein
MAREFRVVYVDNDPIVLAHARALLTSDPAGATAYVDADLRDAAKVLDSAAATLDFAKPIAVTLAMTLHAIGDEDNPYQVVARYIAALAPGSYLAISHPASDIEPDKVADLVARLNQLSRQRYQGRTQAQVLRFFAGLGPVEPGLVQIQHWRPSAETNEVFAVWAGVART